MGLVEAHRLVSDGLHALLEDWRRRRILRLGKLGADRAIHPRLRADADAAAQFERALELRNELEVEVPAWRIGLAVLGRDLTPGEAYDWLERLKVRRRDGDRIAGAITVAPRITNDCAVRSSSQRTWSPSPTRSLRMRHFWPSPTRTSRSFETTSSDSGTSTSRSAVRSSRSSASQSRRRESAGDSQNTVAGS